MVQLLVLEELHMLAIIESHVRKGKITTTSDMKKDAHKKNDKGQLPLNSFDQVPLDISDKDNFMIVNISKIACLSGLKR